MLALPHPGFAQGLELRPGGGRIQIDLSTDAPVYPPGAALLVEARATYRDGTPVVNVRSADVEISDASGQRFEHAELSFHGSGIFTHATVLPAAAIAGRWRVDVTIQDASNGRGRARTTFEVTTAPPVCPDADGDGHQDATCGGDDCDDGDPSVFPGADEICGDGIDQDCDGTDLPCACPDADGDGHQDAACGGDDCDDSNPAVHPGAQEICGDGVDQDCDGSDLPCDGGHGTLTWNGPGTCLSCHAAEAHDVHASVMYQWEGPTPEMDHGPARQGKISGAVNSYCVNIAGNWNACGGCHLGLGALPEPDASPEQLANIDCMLCHQREYRRTKVDGVFVPDEAAMSISMDEAARTVHRPDRSNCLQCHAKAGGGDAVKRGDLSLAHAATSDRVFDVHMSTSGANLRCQQCHTFTGHRVAGRGSDLRPTDSDVRLECANCHAAMAAGEHEGSFIDRHTDRVACQTCHIPRYAKDAADSAASEATEIYRTWLDSHATAPPFHPASEKRNDLEPVYHFWNRLSRNYLVGDDAVIDPTTGRYPTSRPLGAVNDVDSKLYPFKYKVAEQPMTSGPQPKLIPIDTAVFFATADAAAATEAGLVNMGLPSSTAYEWVETDTFQLLNHEVSPSEMALGCNDCHGSSARMDLQGELGYAPKDQLSVLCVQCHGYKTSKGFIENHDKHVKDKRKDCSWCHGFSRPERGLQMPPR